MDALRTHGKPKFQAEFNCWLICNQPVAGSNPTAGSSEVRRALNLRQTQGSSFSIAALPILKPPASLREKVIGISSMLPRDRPKRPLILTAQERETMQPWFRGRTDGAAALRSRMVPMAGGPTCRSLPAEMRSPDRFVLHSPSTHCISQVGDHR